MPKLNNSQRWNVWRHPTVVVKRLSFAVLLLFTFLVLGSATGITAAAERIADKLAGKLVFYVHVAQLYAKEPDQKIAMPVQDVSKNQIANTWHAARGTDRLHEGQDIFAPQGTPILSATEGYIANIGENSLGGQTVSVVGAGGRVYYYAHLDSYAPRIAEGDWVTTQTVLGYVGTTGNAAGTPPHLHFGVYAPGGAMNPLPLLNDRPRPKPTKPAKNVTPRQSQNRER
jgi:murein DD-endopeptidase MepM/ murein hydrolase activator NlpD